MQWIYLPIDYFTRAGKLSYKIINTYKFQGIASFEKSCKSKTGILACCVMAEADEN